MKPSLMKRLLALSLAAQIALPGSALALREPQEDTAVDLIRERLLTSPAPAPSTGKEGEPAAGRAEWDLTIPEPAEQHPLPSFEAVVEEILQAIRAARQAKGGGQIWVGIEGPGGVGKSFLIGALRGALQAEDIPSIELDEGRLGLVDRPTRDQRRLQKDPAPGTQKSYGYRWDKIEADIATVRKTAQGTVALSELYNHTTGLVGETDTVAFSTDSVVCYAGHYLSDEGHYPPRSFDVHILLDAGRGTLQDRRRARDPQRSSGARTPDQVEELFDTVYRPDWEEHVAAARPQDKADLAYNLTDPTHPVRLTYAGGEEGERAAGRAEAEKLLPAGWKLELDPDLLSRLHPGLQPMIRTYLVPATLAVTRGQESLRLMDELHETTRLLGVTSRAAERSFRTVLARDAYLQTDFFRWFNAYVLLPSGLALDFDPAARTIRLIPAEGYELIRLPGEDVPVTLAYTSADPTGEPDSVGWEFMGMAFVRPSTSRREMALARREELGHACDFLLRVRSPENPLGHSSAAAMLGRFHFLARADLGDFAQSAAQGDAQATLNLIKESRALMREMAEPDNRQAYAELLLGQGIVERFRSAPSKGEPLYMRLPAAAAAVWAAARLFSPDGSGPQNASEAQAAARGLWESQFGADDPIRLPGRRVHPVTNVEAARQIARLQRIARKLAAGKEGEPAAGLEEQWLEDAEAAFEVQNGYSLAILPNGHMLIGTHDGTIVGTKGAGRPRWTWTADSVPETIAIDPNGEYVLAQTRDGSLFLYDLKATGYGKLQLRWPVYSVAIHPKREILYVGDGNGWLSAYKKTGNSVTIDDSAGITHNQVLTRIAVDPANGNWIATADGGWRVLLWSSEELDYEAELLHHAGVRSIAFHPDGTRLACGTDDGAVVIWSMQDRKIWARLEDPTLTHPIHRVVFSPDGRQIALIRSGCLEVWDYASGKLLQRFWADDQLTDLAFSPKGDLLSVIDVNGKVRVWRPRGQAGGRQPAPFVASQAELATVRETPADAWHVGGIRLEASAEGEGSLLLVHDPTLYHSGQGAWGIPLSRGQLRALARKGSVPLDHMSGTALPQSGTEAAPWDPHRARVSLPEGGIAEIQMDLGRGVLKVREADGKDGWNDVALPSEISAFLSQRDSAIWVLARETKRRGRPAAEVWLLAANGVQRTAAWVKGYLARNSQGRLELTWGACKQKEGVFLRGLAYASRQAAVFTYNPVARKLIRLDAAPTSTGKEGEPATGLEGIELGKPQPLADGQAGEVIPVTVRDEGARASGRAVLIDPGRAILRQVVNPAVTSDQWPGPAIRDMPKQEQPGLPLDRIIADPTQLDPSYSAPENARPVFASHWLQTNFWEPQGFLIRDGQLVAIPGVTWSAEPEVLVLDGGAPGLRHLSLLNGLPQTEGVGNAVVGPVLVRDGQDLSGEIQQYPPDHPNPNQVRWDPATTRAAFSAVGWIPPRAPGESGRLVFLSLAGSVEDLGQGIHQVSVGNMARAMMALGATQAILLGGSMDVQQWVAGDGAVPGILGHHSNSPHDSGRNLNAAALLVYASAPEAPAVSEEDRKKLLHRAELARRRFRLSGYGWANDLRDPGTPVRVGEVQITSEDSSLVPVILLGPGEKGPLSGYDCLNCAAWIVRMLKRDGIKAEVLKVSDAIWHADNAALISDGGVLVSATPGKRQIQGLPGVEGPGLKSQVPEHPIGWSLQEAQKRLKQRDEEGLEISGRMVPMSWHNLGRGCSAALMGGIELVRTGPKQPWSPVDRLGFQLTAAAVEGDQAGPELTLRIEIPAGSLAELRKRILQSGPGEVLAAAREVAGAVVSAPDPAQVPQDAQRIAQLLLDNQDLLYHMIAKLDPQDEILKRYTAGRAEAEKPQPYKELHASYDDVVRILREHDQKYQIQLLQFYTGPDKIEPSAWHFRNPTNPPPGMDFADLFMEEAAHHFGEEGAKQQTYYLFIEPDRDDKPGYLCAEVMADEPAAPPAGAAESGAHFVDQTSQSVLALFEQFEENEHSPNQLEFYSDPTLPPKVAYSLTTAAAAQTAFQQMAQEDALAAGPGPRLYDVLLSWVPMEGWVVEVFAHAPEQDEKDIQSLTPEEFRELYGDQADQVPGAATDLLVVPEGAQVTLHCPDTLRDEVQALIDRDHGMLPGLTIDRADIPTSPDGFGPHPLLILDAALVEPLPAHLSGTKTPVIEHWKGLPFDRPLPQLVAVALAGDLDAKSVQLLTAWRFEKDGRAYIVFAVQA